MRVKKTPAMRLDQRARIGDISPQRVAAGARDDVMCQPSFPAFDMATMARTDTPGGTDLMFRAFSDRTRLRILHVLRGGELCVGDIVGIRGPSRLELFDPATGRWSRASGKRADLPLARGGGRLLRVRR